MCFDKAVLRETFKAVSEAPRPTDPNDPQRAARPVRPSDAAPKPQPGGEPKAGQSSSSAKKSGGREAEASRDRSRSADQTAHGEVVDEDVEQSRARRRRQRRREEVEAASQAAAASAPQSPPRRVPRKSGWIALLVCMLLILPTMALELASPDVTEPREAIALTRSLHTWANFNSMTDPTATLYERSEPQYNGRADLTVRPMVTWTHMLGFAVLPGVSDEGEAPLETRIFQARLISVVMALMIIGAVYWAGLSIGGPFAALIAALVCATNPLLIMQSRLASEPIHGQAWAMLAIAAALWAIRPLRPAASVERQFIGWVLSGLALGVAILTYGPAAVLHVVIPVGLILVLCPNRVSHLMGLVAALLIGLLLPMPWAVYAHENDRSAWAFDLSQLFPADALVMSGVGYLTGPWLVLVGAVLLPWTLWLIGAVIQPFSTSSAGSRTRLFLGWSWFAVSLAVVMVTTRGEAADLLPLVPAASVLIGQLFSQYSDLAAEGRYPRVWRYGKWIHVGLLVLASIAVGLMPWVHEYMLNTGWLTRPVIGEVSFWLWGLLAFALLGILALSLRWVTTDFPGRVAVTWAVWAAALAPVMMLAVTHSPRMHSQAASDATTIAVTDHNLPVFNLEPYPEISNEVDPIVLLYSRRYVPTVNPEHLVELRDQHAAYYLLAPLTVARPTAEAELVRQLPGLGSQLWIVDATRPSDEGDAAAVNDDEEAAVREDDGRPDAEIDTDLDASAPQINDLLTDPMR